MAVRSGPESLEDTLDLRADGLAHARLWLGTPYRHQASLLGEGCDCLGLIRGVWRHLYATEPEPLPAYQPDWVVQGDADPLVEAARRWLVEWSSAERAPGDVVLFRWREGLPARHAGLLSGGGRLIHAYERVGVVESPLVPAWERRLSHVFRFPPRAQAPLLQV